MDIAIIDKWRDTTLYERFSDMHRSRKWYKIPWNYHWEYEFERYKHIIFTLGISSVLLHASYYATKANLRNRQNGETPVYWDLPISTG